jgi:hypothetical protein
LRVTTLIDRTNAVSADLFGDLDETTSAATPTPAAPVRATLAAVAVVAAGAYGARAAIGGGTNEPN